MENQHLSSSDVSVLIDHVLKSKDPATVGLRKILKRKQHEAEQYPLHPLSFEDFHESDSSGDKLSKDDRQILTLEKKVHDLQLSLEKKEEQHKNALVSAHASGVKEGTAKGETEGRKKAKAEFDLQVSLLQKKIASILETVELSKKKIYTDSHDILLKLCFAIVQKMIHTESVTNKELVLHVIKNSLSYIADREKIIIRVAPDDVETAAGNMDFFLPIGERFESVVIEKDKRVEKGGCIIESNSGMADSRLGIQLEELKSLVETVWQSVASGI